MGFFGIIKTEKIYHFPSKNCQLQVSTDTEDNYDELLLQNYKMVYLRCLEILKNEENAMDTAHNVIIKIMDNAIARRGCGGGFIPVFDSSLWPLVRGIPKDRRFAV